MAIGVVFHGLSVRIQVCVAPASDLVMDIFIQMQWEFTFVRKRKFVNYPALTRTFERNDQKRDRKEQR
jgi:hypothetical protein